MKLVPHNQAREMAHQRDQLLQRARDLHQSILWRLRDCGCEQCVNLAESLGPVEQCEAQPLPPVQRAYHNTSAQGVTS